MITRCCLVTVVLWLLCCAVSSHAQGIISAGAPAIPRRSLSSKPWPVSLVDVAPQAGFRMHFTSGQETIKKYVIEANGSGVAFLDYNNDGLLDVFLVNGSRLTGFPSGRAPTNYLYRNDGGGKFTDVTAASGLSHSGWGNGVCVADFDNDGALDMYVTYWGENVLYRNKGDGTFADISSRSGTGTSKSTWSTGCTFVDYDRDGRVDLLVTSYLQFDLKTTPLPGREAYCMWKGSPVFCGPRGLPFGSIRLLRNLGDGTFQDVSAASGIDKVKGFYAFTALATDLTGDGWPDIYIACDSTPSILFRNEKDGTFRDIATEAGVAYSENGAEQAGMGLAVGDFDNDGRLDLMKTNFTGDYPNLYRGTGKGVFSETALKAGLGVNPDNVLWGAGFADFDNDGWKDIFHVSGHVYPDVALIDKRESYKRPRLVYRNLGSGQFEDVSGSSGPGVMFSASSRGAAFGDFDNDGDIDVLIMNMHESPSLLRNDLKSANNWVKFTLQGTASNRSAIGAIVTIEAGGVRQTDAVLSQSSFLSANDLRLHFGLGATTRVDRIMVQWPSGNNESFPGVASKQLYRLVEGSGIASPVELKR